MNLRKLTLSIGFLAVVVAFSACDDDLLDDATFRMWCGSTLCSWRVDAGDIKQAPTWHKNDLGVELVSPGTTISQDMKGTSRCLTFTTIADVELSAQVVLGIDFTGDGKVDYEQPISAVGFRQVKTLITSPELNILRVAGESTTPTPPRVFITKKGTGRAVLAQIRLQVGSGCTAPRIRLENRPLGDRCALGEPSECASGVCCEGLCAECCVDPKAFDVDPDGGVAPAPLVPCANSASCIHRDVPYENFFFASVPLQCAPGQSLRPAGAVCLADDDCTSGICEGGFSSAFHALPDGGTERCSGEFPDASASGCKFYRVSEGRCQ